MGSTDVLLSSFFSSSPSASVLADGNVTEEGNAFEGRVMANTAVVVLDVVCVVEHDVIEAPVMELGRMEKRLPSCADGDGSGGVVGDSDSGREGSVASPPSETSCNRRAISLEYKGPEDDKVGFTTVVV